MSFAFKLPKAKAVDALEKQKIILEQEEKAINAGYEAKLIAMQGKLPALTQLAFDNMLEIVQVQSKFVHQAIEIMNKSDSLE